MPRVRLRNTYRTRVGIEIPGADPSKRLRGEFIEVTRNELDSLKAALGDGGRFPDLSEENIEIDSVSEAEDALARAVGPKTAESLRAAGVETIEEAKEASDDALGEIEGVGPATIENIRSA